MDYPYHIVTKEEFHALNWINVEHFPNSHTLLFFEGYLIEVVIHILFLQNILSFEANGIKNREEWCDRRVAVSLPPTEHRTYYSGDYKQDCLSDYFRFR
jgi:hypothetical protein